MMDRDWYVDPLKEDVPRKKKKAKSDSTTIVLVGIAFAIGLLVGAWFM